MSGDGENEDSVGKVHELRGIDGGKPNLPPDVQKAVDQTVSMIGGMASAMGVDLKTLLKLPEQVDPNEERARVWYGFAMVLTKYIDLRRGYTQEMMTIAVDSIDLLAELLTERWERRRFAAPPPLYRGQAAVVPPPNDSGTE